MYSDLVRALVAVAVAYTFTQALLRYTQDAKEPPVVRFAIPFIGPINGMIKEKFRFYSNLR